MKNKTIGLLFSCVAMLITSCGDKQESLISVVDHGLVISTEHGLNMAKVLETQDGRLPKTINKKGELETSDYGWWCSGFFSGQLWYLYENNPTAELKQYAEMYTNRVENAKKITYSHDVGFMLNCSYGHAYRITGNEAYKEVLIEGANSLSTRFDDRVGAIRSWDFNKKIWQYPVIIDNMMNLEFLGDVSRLSGDTRYKELAVAHANKTMEHHFRPDYSSYHVVTYDTITGLPHKKQTHQGYADETAWARGQAWALYGFTVMYRQTGNPEYLSLANNIGRFLINHPSMPEDKIPYWDFDAPDIPNEPRDASAAAIMASAFIELSAINKDDFGKECFKIAELQIRSLTSPEYLACAGENKNFILKHSTGHFPNGSEVDKPLSYADYYYVEALLRMKKLLLSQS